MLPVKTIMTTDVITVKKETSIFEALDLLTKHKISGMPVVDNENRVIGILSEKDVLKILLGKKSDAQKTVSDYMSHKIFSFTEEDSAVDVCKFFMRNHIRRVPIVRDGKLVGIVSRRDIVALIIEAQRKISDLRYT